MIANGRVLEAVPFEAPPARGLPADVLRLLEEPLDPALVAVRRANRGRRVAYLEGHRVISQANRLFGYGRWGAELQSPVGFRELSCPDPESGEVLVVGMYWATVRVQVAGCQPRSDVGCAFATDSTPEAHDTAIKAAATDAMKRALRQFGEQFGNSLYGGNGVKSDRDEGADLRAAALTLGRRLGLSQAETRRRIGHKAGRAFEDLETVELARIVRAMAEALGRGKERPKRAPAGDGDASTSD